MALIIDLMKRLNFPSNEGGVCFGLALMAERARRIGQYDLYKKRVDYLNKVGLFELEILISNAKEHVKNIRLNKTSESLTEEEELLLSIEPFFFQVWMHFQPSAIQKFLGLSGSSFSQTDISSAEALMYDLEAEEPGLSVLKPPQTFFISNHNNSENPSMKVFLEKIQDTSDKEQLSLGLVLCSVNHAMHVFYDSKTKKWTITNHSIIVEKESIEDVVSYISTGFSDIFSKNEINNLAIHMYSDEKPEKIARLHSDLQSIANNSLKAAIEEKRINAADSYGGTPLKVAAAHGFTEIVEELLNTSEIDINQADDKGKTALIAAVEMNQLEVVKLLLKHPDIDPNKGRPLRLAAEGGFNEILNELLHHSKIKTTSEGSFMSPLRIAIQHEKLDTIKVLLDAGIDSSFSLAYAIEKNQFNIALELLKHPAIDVDSGHGTTPLMLAIRKGQFDIVRELLKKDNCIVNYNDGYHNTAIILAVKEGHLDIVRELIKKEELDVNYCGYLVGNKSALANAIDKKDIDIAQELLKHPKIKVNEKNNNGMSLLKLALASDRKDIVNDCVNKMRTQVINGELELKDMSDIERNYYIMHSIVEFIELTCNQLQREKKYESCGYFEEFLAQFKKELTDSLSVLNPDNALADLDKLVDSAPEVMNLKESYQQIKSQANQLYFNYDEMIKTQKKIEEAKTAALNEAMRIQNEKNTPGPNFLDKAIEQDKREEIYDYVKKMTAQIVSEERSFDDLTYNEKNYYILYPVIEFINSACSMQNSDELDQKRDECLTDLECELSVCNMDNMLFEPQPGGILSESVMPLVKVINSVNLSNPTFFSPQENYLTKYFQVEKEVKMRHADILSGRPYFSA